MAVDYLLLGLVFICNIPVIFQYTNKKVNESKESSTTHWLSTTSNSTVPASGDCNDPFNMQEYLIATNVISAVSVICAFVLCALAKEEFRNHRFILINYFGCLICNYVIRTMSHAYDLESYFLGCIFQAVFAQYLLLSVFFWLNVLAVALWKKLRNFQSMVDDPKGNNKLLQVLYACGVPALFTAVTFSCSWVEEEGDISRIYPHCCLKTNYIQKIFLDAPRGAILVCNVGLYICTLRSIYRAKKDFQNSEEVHMIRLGIRLLQIMGFEWTVCYTLRFIIQLDYNHGVPGLINGMNSMTGFFISLIFFIRWKEIKSRQKKTTK